MRTIVISAMFAARIATSPTYFPTRNCHRRTGLARMLKTVRLSTSRLTRSMLIITAINIEKNCIAARPMSLTILVSSPTVSRPKIFVPNTRTRANPTKR